jgi:chromosome segregation ATPase
VTNESTPLEGIIVNDEDIVSFPVNGLPDAKLLSPLWHTEGAVEPILERLRTVIRSMPKGNVLTKTGRAEIASLAYKIAGAKSRLEKFGKELADDAKNLPKIIDGNRRILKDGLEELQVEVRKPLDDFDEELLRLKSKLEAIRANAPSFMDRTAEQLQARLDALKAMTIASSEWGDMAEEAVDARAQSVATLTGMLAQRVTYDAEQVELEKLRVEKAAREQADRDAEIAKKAAEEATRTAEEKIAAEHLKEVLALQAAKDAKEAAEKAQKEAEEAQERAEARAREVEAQANQQAEEARLRAIEEEQTKQRLEQEARDAEQKKRDDDVEHRRAFNREALTDIVTAIKGAPFATSQEDVDSVMATAILTAIVQGKIKHVRLTY